MQRISAAAAERRARRQKKAAAVQAVEQMDPRLLDDIGVGAAEDRPAGLRTACRRLNPAFLAARPLFTAAATRR